MSRYLDILFLELSDIFFIFFWLKTMIPFLKYFLFFIFRLPFYFSQVYHKNVIFTFVYVFTRTFFFYFPKSPFNRVRRPSIHSIFSSFYLLCSQSRSLSEFRFGWLIFQIKIHLQKNDEEKKILKWNEVVHFCFHAQYSITIRGKKWPNLSLQQSVFPTVQPQTSSPCLNRASRFSTEHTTILIPLNLDTSLTSLVQTETECS